MKTPTLARTTNLTWLRRGIAVVSTLLIGGIVSLSLATQLRSNRGPAAASAAYDAGRERFAALKQAQVDARDAAFDASPTYDAGREQFAAMKERQAELHDATVVPASIWSSALERFAVLKQWVAEQIMDAAMGNVSVPTTLASNQRFLALKQRQVEMRDATFVPASAALSAQERFAALKERHAELRDTMLVPAPPAPSPRERIAELKQRQAELREEGR
jgi:hypothetical protein